MPANAINRGDPQAAIATLFQTAMVGPGLPVQSVVPYFLDWQADETNANMQSPYLCIAPSGTASKDRGINDKRWANIFVYECIAFFRAPDNANNWSEQDLETQMNLVDKYIRDVIADNRVNDHWSFIGFSQMPGQQPEPSEIIPDPARGCRIELRKIYVHYIEV